MSTRTLPVALLVLATAACGKKGPPLLPFARVPDAAEITATRRLGDDIYLTVTVPSTDIDKEKPASLERIEIYGATAMTPPPRTRFLDIATLVATVPVARAPDPGDTTGTIVPDPGSGALQGTTTIVRDSLSAEEMIPRELPVLATETRRPSGVATFTPPPVPQALRRFYMTVPFSHRGRTGPPSAIVELPLTPLPDRVAGLHVSLTVTSMDLSWEPSGGLLGWLLDRSLPSEIPPIEEPPPVVAAKPVPTSDLPPGPTLYNIYRELAADPVALPDMTAVKGSWTISAAVPLNAEPVPMLTFTDLVPFDERERCYYVRAVRGTGAQRVESDASDRVCILAADIEPPSAVTGLAAIGSEGVIDLSWEPNGEQDLGGYIVLRREPGNDTLLQLTPQPIADTRFTDKAVTAGRTYAYVVHAVDNRFPLPNMSAPAEVTETAR